MLEAARTLARVHGHTIGRFDAYQEIRSGFGRYEPPSVSTPPAWLITVNDELSNLGIVAGDSFLQSASELVETAGSDAPFFGLVHGDPCPDNWLVTPSGLRLFDFEFSGYRQDGFGLVTIDAVYPRMCFPTCWCTGATPAPLVERFESAYRTELATVCPAAADGQMFEEAMLLACGAWFLSTLEWHLSKALQEDETWGRAGIRARVLTRAAALLAACDRFGRLPALEDVASRLQDVLRQRWPESDVLPLYPAFSQ
jgi:hypothetical protein